MSNTNALRLWMKAATSAALGIGSLDPFGFPWRRAVSLRKPPIMRVGFPWISSSEARLFNGLRGIKRRKFFVIGFFVMSAAPGQEPASWHAKAQHRHGASLSPFLISCNQLPSKPVSPSASIQKQPALAARAQMLLNPEFDLAIGLIARSIAHTASYRHEYFAIPR